ncbi:MAG: hypothetical protein GF355_00810 [Candidatus Eisenbacteria bacterium]|nr:hypothetical protein [Candidatus Eisenbacteria bacterium]
MPHIELRGKIALDDLYRRFAPAARTDGGTVFRTRTMFRRQDGRELLVEALVVEEHLKQEFLVQLRDRQEGLLLRLYPGTPVQRTEGVKRFLVWLAAELRRRDPGLEVGRTNLDAHLDAFGLGSAAPGSDGTRSAPPGD